jgi:hypothetical protein
LNCLVVVADREHAVFYRITGDDARELARFETKAKIDVGTHTSTPPKVTFHHGTHGTPGADVAARQADAAYERHRARIIENIRSLAGRSCVVIAGAADTAVRLNGELPAEIGAHARIAPDIHAQMSLAELTRATARWNADMQAAKAAALVERALFRARSSPHAVMGLGPVRVALEQHAVGHLYLSVAQLDTDADAIERIVRAALSQGAVLHFVQGAAADALDKSAAGAAAELRFPISALHTNDLTGTN